MSEYSSSWPVSVKLRELSARRSEKGPLEYTTFEWVVENLDRLGERRLEKVLAKTVGSQGLVKLKSNGDEGTCIRIVANTELTHEHSLLNTVGTVVDAFNLVFAEP
jgi:hypothetical protein